MTDSVAQQVEHNTFNVGVLGSSPSWVTKRKRTGTAIPVFSYTDMRKRIMLIAWCLAFVLPVVAQQSDEQLAAYYYDHGQYEQAAQLYENLYKRGYNRYHYQRLLSTYLESGQYRDAERLVNKRQKTNPKDLYLFVDEGVVYLRQNQEKKARKCFDEAINKISTNLQPIPDLAQAFLAAGQNTYAVRTYLTAREKSRNRTLYFTELVGVYQQMGDYSAMTGEYFDLLDNQPRMMSSVQISMQHAMQEAPDHKLADGIRREIVNRVRTHPESRVYTDMLIWFAIQDQDYNFALEQAEATDARFPDANGEQVMQVAQIAHRNGNLGVAADAYRYIQKKGSSSPYYFDSKVGELQVEYDSIGNSLILDNKSFSLLRAKYMSTLEELGRNERTIQLMRNFATLAAYHGGDAQEAVDMLDDILEMPRLKPHLRDEVKLELGDLLLFAGETWDASLLYSQVEKDNKNDVLGSTAKLRNARLSYYNHDFEWAKSQLNVLRASTSKLVANDAMELSLLISDNMEEDSTFDMLEIFADADLKLYRNRLDEAWNGFDEISRSNLSHPLLDEVLFRKAEIRMRQARYTEADSLLERLTEFYPFDILADDALVKRAELNEKWLRNNDVAKECYEKILLDYPSSLYTDQARKRYNILKNK